MKTCSRCKKTKPLEQFFRDRSKADGRHSQCKVCQSAREKVYRQSEEGKIVRKVYEQSEKGKIAFRKYLAANPEKKQAANSVGYATQVGILVRPNTCEHCLEFHDKIEAHHESYAKLMRLVVVWLCRACHKKEHQRLKELI